ncbi:hypothetical protein GO613_17670 [Azoarcus communis]|uniref:Co-chaperone DjlA N-terminal domain-containing protein n=1 Tax=Parazoarcus communis SWub3 = DSM 12120 TaxID=1121029 RepID=A0A323UUM0_9RHOO|nr:TerB family tellurite resistance protein [Parazoarcus communis]NMG49927.1 hypothetical protein [Parazoarcus communis]NMG70868.1 hypothetical protein [Parazoarcus communis SWub3 = DSM 12120]PZA16239.1 hypothetical protein DNK49_13085 [Azoarcus communis] [Parazoarcus communis SWub3 = DSM 12120]
MTATLGEQRHTAAHLIALTMIADGELASRELDALDRHAIPDLLGVPRDVLVQSLLDHCRSLRPSGEGQAVRVVDLERFERLLDSVTDPALRMITCRAMLVLSKADGRISPPEQTLLRHALTRWGLDLAALS